MVSKITRNDDNSTRIHNFSKGFWLKATVFPAISKSFAEKHDALGIASRASPASHDASVLNAKHNWQINWLWSNRQSFYDNPKGQAHNLKSFCDQTQLFCQRTGLSCRLENTPTAFQASKNCQKAPQIAPETRRIQSCAAKNRD